MCRDRTSQTRAQEDVPTPMSFFLGRESCGVAESGEPAEGSVNSGWEPRLFEAGGTFETAEAGIDADPIGIGFRDDGLPRPSNPSRGLVESVEMHIRTQFDTGNAVGGLQVEGFKAESNKHSSVNDDAAHGLLNGNLQATDSGQKQPVMEFGFPVATKNMSVIPSKGIASGVTVGGIGLGGGSTVDDYHGNYYEASVSQILSLGVTDQCIRREGSLVPGEEMQSLEPMSIDGTSVGLAGKELSPSGPALQVDKQDVLPIDKNLMSPRSGAVANVPDVEAGTVDEHLDNYDFVRSGDLVLANVGLDEVVVDMEMQSSGSHQVYGNEMDEGDTFMADAGSLAIAVVEPQSRDTQVIDEKSSAVENQAAATRPLDENSMEKVYFIVEDPTLVANIGVPKTSESSENWGLASQGKESFVSIGDNQDMGAMSAGSFFSKSLGADAHEAGSSHCIGRIDMESNVLKEGFPAPVEQEVELVQSSEAEQQTPSPQYNMVDDITETSELSEVFVANICVPETSEPSETRALASQGQESFVSIDCNQYMGALSAGSLANSSLGADAHQAESSLGIGRMDVESNVLEGFPAPDEQEVELVQRSESEQQTPSPRYNMADVMTSTDADVMTSTDTVLIGDQDLFESSDMQIPQQHMTVTPWTSYKESNQRAHYNLPPRDTTKFSVSDLVWGKVKSHPWWPGQIYYHSDASELALKHQRKENFLVAYFGDRTFAWRDESQLKPFYSSFPQMERQSSPDAFIYAVNDALGEVSRRMELGMACSCLPEEEYADIKCPKVENAGIREGTNNSFFDRSLVVNCFDHNRLLEYIMALAQIPTGRADRLELVIAKAQLKAFYRLKGYPELPEFIFGRGLMENDVEVSASWGKNVKEFADEYSTPSSSELIPGKRKRGRPPKKQKKVLNDVEVTTPRDKKPKEFAAEHSTPLSSELVPGITKRGRPPKKQKHLMEDSIKQKSLSELMEEKNVFCLANGGKSGSSVESVGLLNSSSASKKGKVAESDSGSPYEIGECIHDSGESKRKRKEPVVDLDNKPRPVTLSSSFKVGEYIRRVASRLTGSPNLKCHGDRFQKRVSRVDYGEGDVDPDAFPSAPVSKRRTKAGITEDYPSPDEMLSQLCLAASDPLKGYTFMSMVVSFFTNFRNSCAFDSPEDSKHSRNTGGKRGRKKAVESESASSDMSTPDHMKDSYWSDMISDNSSGKGQVSNGKQWRKRKSAGQPSPSRFLGPIRDTAQQLQFGTVSPNMTPTLSADRSVISVEEKIVDTPTALILSFNSLDSLPSEADLIRIFGRYGPLRASETEIMRKTNRVKVVFKRRADAEIAFSSAGKYSIFGPALLSYKLKPLPSASKVPPDSSRQGETDVTPIKGGNLGVSDQAETGVVSNTSPVEDVGKG